MCWNLNQVANTTCGWPAHVKLHNDLFTPLTTFVFMLVFCSAPIFILHIKAKNNSRLLTRTSSHICSLDLLVARFNAFPWVITTAAKGRINLLDLLHHFTVFNTLGTLFPVWNGNFPVSGSALKSLESRVFASGTRVVLLYGASPWCPHVCSTCYYTSRTAINRVKGLE